ncbi:MAG: hypothetical protein VW438_00070 [Euryarchaeota archaeon]
MANLSAFGGAQPITPGGLVELGYGENDANLSITATTGAGMDNISPELTVVCDGSPIMVEFFCATARATVSGSGTTDALWFTLKVDGSVQEERLGTIGNVAGGYGSLKPVHLAYRMTPTAGSHTFRVGGWVSNAARSGYIGGGSPYPPAWIRVSKIVQQNDGLKPFWTPPLVTQLPTNPTVGDTVIYAADATNGVYWNLYYDGIGSYPWKYVGGPPLYDAGGGYQAITSTSYIDLTGVTINTTLAGDYDVRLDAQLQQPNGNGWVTYLSVSHAGGTLGDYTYPIVYAPSTSGTDNGASRTARILGLAANNTLQGRARVNAGTGYVGYCRLTATPVRVAA